MMGRDDLAGAREALQKYREKSLCGYCREYADTMIDTLDAMVDIDKNMEGIVMAKMGHPKMSSMPQLSETMRGLREKSAEMLRGETGERRRDARNGGIFGFREMARGTANDIRDIVPRPAYMLKGRRR